MTLASNNIIAGLNSTFAVCPVPSTNNFALAYSSGTVRIRQYDITSRLQTGSDITITNTPCSIAPLSSTLIACLSGNNTTHHVVSLATGTVSNLTGMTNGRTSSLFAQQLASDPVSGIAFGCSSTTATLQKFESVPAITGSTFTVRWLIQSTAHSIIKRSDNSNFIAMTSLGNIVEFDPTGRAVKGYAIPSPKFFYEHSFNTNTVNNPPVGGWLAYYAGYLLVSTSYGQIILFDHDRGTEVHRETVGNFGSNSQAVTLRNNGQTVLMAQGLGNGLAGAAIFEFDMLKIPFEFRGYIFTSSGQTSQGATDVVIINNNAAFVQQNNGSLLCTTQSGARVVDLVPTIINPADPQEGHCIVLEDNGVGNCQLMFASPVGVGGRNIPITQGANHIKLSLSGDGVAEKFGVSRPI